MATKHFFKSKIVWVQVLSTILTVAALIDARLLTDLGIATEQQTRIMAAVGLVINIVTIALRANSNAAVTFKKKPNSNQ